MPKQDVSEGEHFDVSEDDKNEFAIPLTEDESSSSMMETNRAAFFASRFLLFDKNCVGILTFIGQILFFLCFICLYSLILGIDGVASPYGEVIISPFASNETTNSSASNGVIPCYFPVTDQSYPNSSLCVIPSAFRI